MSRARCGGGRDPRSGGSSRRRGNVQIFDTRPRRARRSTAAADGRETRGTAMRDFLKPQEILLVADAATGQQAVSVATHFNDALQHHRNRFDQARWRRARWRGAFDARSDASADQIRRRRREARSVRGLRAGSDWLAGSSAWATSSALVEKQPKPSMKKKRRGLERKLRTASFDFNDFLAQFKMMRKMGRWRIFLACCPA